MTRLQFEEIFPKEYEIIRQMEEDDQGLDFVFVRLERTSAGEILTETKKAISESGKYSPTDDIVAKAFEKVKSAVHKDRSFVYSVYTYEQYKETRPIWITHMKTKINDVRGRIVFVIVLRPDDMTVRDHAALSYMLRWMQQEDGADESDELNDISNLLVHKLIDVKTIKALSDDAVVSAIKNLMDRNFKALTSDSDAAFGYGDYVKVLNFEKLNTTTLCHLVKSFNHLKAFYLETYDNVVGFTAPETWYSNHPEDADYVEEFELWNDDYEIEILSYLWSLIESNLKSAVIKLPTGSEDNIYLINSGYGETHEELIAALNEYSDFDHPLYEADSYYDI